MNFVTFCETEQELLNAKKHGVDELILEHQNLSRFGKLSTQQINDFARRCTESGIRPILQWDLLKTENDFAQMGSIIKEVELELFYAVRAQDMGVVQYLLDQYPNSKIQLNLENSFHNLRSVQALIDYLGDRLDRLILSTELPAKVIESWISKIEVPVEILGMGRILLFYSPRKLLSFANSEYNSDHEILGSSEESPHKGFVLRENQHGTFMFHIKNQFLLEKLQDLKTIGLSYFLLDFRFGQDIELLHLICDLADDFSEDKALLIKKEYGESTTSGYYATNRSDVLFKKLKNRHTKRDDKSYLGEVLDIYKKEYLVIGLKNPKLNLSMGDKLLITTPEGNKLNVTVSKMKNTLLEDLQVVDSDSIVLINYVRKVTNRSVVHLSIEDL